MNVRLPWGACPFLLVSCCMGVAALRAQAPARPAQSSSPAEYNAAGIAVEKAATASLPSLASRPLERVQFDRPRPDGSLWAIGSSWKASFDGRGFQFIPFFGSDAPDNYPLRLELARVTVGGDALALTAGEPAERGTTVRTPRGALTEVIDTKLDSVEQSFVFERLPQRGAIAIDVAVATTLAAAPIADGLRFTNAFGHVDYTKAIAVDAGGNHVALPIEWTGTGVRIVIPAAFVEEAQLPLVLDPVLSSAFNLSPGQTQLQYESDVASYQQNGGRTLLIYHRQYSSTDHDCWGILFDGNLGIVANNIPIDFTTDDWLKAADASSNYAQNFLVVSEVRVGLVWFIGGRIVNGNGTMGSQFDIERAGVIGIGGNNYAPDVGGDPYYGVGRYCVVFENRVFTSDIYMRQITTSGGQVTANPVPLATGINTQQRPAISKSCGQASSLSRWLVTYEEVPAFPPAAIQGQWVNWNGVVIGGAIPISFFSQNAREANPGSPIDVGNTRLWPVVYTQITGGLREVVCQTVAANSGVSGTFVVGNGPPSEEEFAPEVDSDGTRIVVVMSKQTGTGPRRVEAVTLALVNGVFRVDDRTGLGTSSIANYGEMNVCADYSGGSGLSPRYVISMTHLDTNTLAAIGYGGYVNPGSTGFFSVYPSQCGSLSIAASGSSVIGQTVRFDVGNGPLSGTILGTPGYIPLNALGCNCVQGVENGLYLGNPLEWTVPNNPAFVGITLSAQGWTVAGTQCLGFVDLSDTIDFTIR